MYDFGIRQPLTGYRIQYRAGETNHCPGCGKTAWHVGRFSAECAFCSTSLEMPGVRRLGSAMLPARNAA